MQALVQLVCIVALSISPQKCHADSVFVPERVGFSSPKYEPVLSVPLNIEGVPVGYLPIYEQRQLWGSEDRHGFLRKRGILSAHCLRLFSGAEYGARRLE